MVVEGEGWHRGVIGICASRLVERFGRPAVVISRDGDEAHGSGRSIPGFHLLDALETAPELFLRFGGHAAAVGFAMRAENVAELRQRLNQYARTKLAAEELQPVLEYDGELDIGAGDAALLGAAADFAAVWHGQSRAGVCGARCIPAGRTEGDARKAPEAEAAPLHPRRAGRGECRSGRGRWGWRAAWMRWAGAWRTACRTSRSPAARPWMFSFALSRTPIRISAAACNWCSRTSGARLRSKNIGGSRPGMNRSCVFGVHLPAFGKCGAFHSNS